MAASIELEPRSPSPLNPRDAGAAHRSPEARHDACTSAIAAPLQERWPSSVQQARAGHPGVPHLQAGLLDREPTPAEPTFSIAIQTCTGVFFVVYYCLSIESGPEPSWHLSGMDLEVDSDALDHQEPELIQEDVQPMEGLTLGTRMHDGDIGRRAGLLWTRIGARRLLPC